MNKIEKDDNYPPKFAKPDDFIDVILVSEIIEFFCNLKYPQRIKKDGNLPSLF